MLMRVIDIGGSGVKTTTLADGVACEDLESRTIERFPDPDWNDFPRWAHRQGLLDCAVIGVSCAGFVEAGSTVRLFRVAKWINEPLARQLSRLALGSRVHLLNDAESHLMAHAGWRDTPTMCLSLGTALGFAISDGAGRIVRPPDDANFDVGELAIPTRASNNRAWWALGSHGLRELQAHLGDDAGARHWGNRLGAFLASICSIFRPRVVVLSGGIAERWWDTFEPTLRSEFRKQRPDWLGQTDIVRSPYGAAAALIGVARYARLRECAIEPRA